jgi:NAD(P)-dependent dehydrogenase (short-subunit alcohol dehydrogenase family)
MKAKKDGSVIIVSSIGGVRASTVIGAYCISKAADMQLARNLAAEVAFLRFNCIQMLVVGQFSAKSLAIFQNISICSRNILASKVTTNGLKHLQICVDVKSSHHNISSG